MSKTKNGGLDQYGTLNALKCNHLASPRLKGLKFRLDLDATEHF